ncbi:fimbrial protein [Paraburkholderia denitrificans]|uniref:Fimbrial protein n=1 Tax=Paraburkholderia denitrificans TaxID=694025 RepID=A0ABW0J930_9BURK
MLIDCSNEVDPASVRIKTASETLHAQTDRRSHVSHAQSASHFLGPVIRGARQSACVATLEFLTLTLVPGSVLAASLEKGCWKIEGETSSEHSPKYTQPGTIARYWGGATDGAGAAAHKMTVQMTSFTKDGALIGSSISSLNHLGREGLNGYNGEQILFRCSPDSVISMHEFFSTNGDNRHAGGTDMSHEAGVPGTYRFPEKDIVSRVTNVDTGQTVTRNWLARQMSNLDTDKQGWFLVKVKNFSRYKVELFQCKTCGSESNNALQPIAYVAFRGGANGTHVINDALAVGADHAVNTTGQPEYWPGAISPKRDLTVRTGKVTCAVRNTTPVVRFQTMSVAELESRKNVTVPITIGIQCEKAFGKPSSGTDANQTAMGIMAREENAGNANRLGLLTAGSAVSHLLSDGYGKKNVANGVGVKLSRPNGKQMYFLTNRYVTMGGAKDGWDPVLNDATESGSDSNWNYYTRTVNATFEAFDPGKEKVTAGKYNATADVVISIQ